MKTPVKNKEIEYRVLDNECIMLLPAKGQFFKLNEAGTRIWKLVNGKTNEEGITKQIAKEFDVKEERAKKDVKKFLSELKKKNMLK